jgi:hypothetical protein
MTVLVARAFLIAPSIWDHRDNFRIARNTSPQLSRSLRVAFSVSGTSRPHRWTPEILTPDHYWGTFIRVKIACDPAKRAAILEERGLDMLDAVKVFAGPTATWLDDRFNYGETPWLTAGSCGRLDPTRRISTRDLDEVLPCQGSPQVPPPLPRGVRR